MAQGSFKAQIDAWVAKTKERGEAVYKESAQRVIETMQRPRAAGGNMRVDTGFLRASLVASTSGIIPPTTAKPDDIPAFSYDAMQVNLVIAGADLKDTITAVYTANYARFREYGSRGQTADRFVALAAQQWPQIVDRVVAEAKARAGG